jgi:large subunit ribosomal protein L19
MDNLIKNFENKHLSKIKESRDTADFNYDFRVGDSVRVKYKISEANNTRLQAFVGVIISTTKNNSSYSATFTVRKISDSIGVERKFVLYSPLIASIEIIKKGIVRRAKLYYLRNLTGKAARIKEKLDFTSKKTNS